MKKINHPYAKKLTTILYLLIFSLLVVFVNPAAAQEDEEIVLRLSRDFGYSSGGDIQGTFSMKVTGPDDLEKVIFYIDDQVIGEDQEAPFSLRFVTDNYTLGVHSISAVGISTTGQEYTSRVIRAEFVSAEEGWQTAGKIMVPMLVLIAVAMVASSVLPALLGRSGKDTPPGSTRNYGMRGGAICPRCSRPYVLPFLSPNLVFHKLARCPYCGKWAMVRPKSLNELRAAEAAELERAKTDQPAIVSDEEEKLRKDLEDSRYRDL